MIHIGEKILGKLKERERSVAWLAKKVNCDPNNLRRRLKESQYIHSEQLWHISIALEEDFFAYYSQILQAKFQNGK